MSEIKDINYFIKYEEEEIKSFEDNLENLKHKWFKTSNRMKEIEALEIYVKLREELLLRLMKGGLEK